MQDSVKRAALRPPGGFTLALAGLAAVSGASILPRQAEYGPGLDDDGELWRAEFPPPRPGRKAAPA